MKKFKLQAHKGVSSDCPENTMSAFRCAVMQKYDVIELDLEYTIDKEIVVLHDKHLNRTARNNDGTKIETEICINDITYKDALQYDFGIAFSNKYRKEKLPMFKDVLKLAKETNTHLKIDNKIQLFPEEILSIIFLQIKDYQEYVSVSSCNIEFVKKCLETTPNIEIDYDGEVTEKILNNLSAMVPRERLTVWMPYRCKNTSWVTIPFADENTSDLIKKYAKLGIWLLSDYDSLSDAVNRFNPDIIETNGTIKPHININNRYDMHTHSKHSHDSQCEIYEMANMAEKQNLCGFAVTDHCDIEYYDTTDINDIAKASFEDAVCSNSKTDLTVLKGIEIGEATWHKTIAEYIINGCDFDVIVGSVHAVKFIGYEIPYSKIDFSKISKKIIEKYLDRYFDDILEMIEKCDFDVLAHLTCPLRYINGKYKIGIDCKLYENKINHILKCIIDKKIALEVNTSCVYDGSNYSEFMPNDVIIQMYKDMGGYLITTGSDAHIAANSANNFNTLYSLLKKIGFKNTYYYKNRYPIQCTIE